LEKKRKAAFTDFFDRQVILRQVILFYTIDEEQLYGIAFRGL
jgi:hypothetical protein